MIEALLVTLPLPDPKEAQDKFNELSSKAIQMVKGKDNQDQ